MENHRLLEVLYHGAKCNEYFQPKLEIGAGEATVSLDARSDMHHAVGAVHGSTLFKLLDDAAFMAANSLVADHWVTTAGFNVHFLRPVSEGRLVATGRVIKPGRTLIVAESTLVSEDGKEIARGLGSFAITGVPLVEETGGT